MRKFLIAGALGVAVLAFAAPSAAEAHEPRGRGFGYYGNGNHDLVPHWHKTQTPFGSVRWYGNGLHDLMPHGHSVSPWGGVRSYSDTPFGPTKSYNGFPSFGGYGSYYGGYSPFYR